MIYILDPGLGKTRRGWPSDRAESSCVMDVDYSSAGTGQRGIREDAVGLGIAEIVWEVFIFFSLFQAVLMHEQWPGPAELQR